MTAVTAPSKLKRIRELNDKLRQTFTGGQIVMTAGVAHLDNQMKALVLNATRAFTDFDEGNDPHSEHDFGSFDIASQRFFFKIDYYNRQLDAGSDDPSDPAVTKRVLTVMLAEEY